MYFQFCVLYCYRQAAHTTGTSDKMEYNEETSVPDESDNACVTQFNEILPLDRMFDYYHSPEFTDPVVEVKQEDLLYVKQEPADEYNDQVPYSSINVSCMCICDFGLSNSEETILFDQFLPCV